MKTGLMQPKEWKCVFLCACVSELTVIHTAHNPSLSRVRKTKLKEGGHVDLVLLRSTVILIYLLVIQFRNQIYQRI